mgnify:CR=1 FL=1
MRARPLFVRSFVIFNWNPRFDDGRRGGRGDGGGGGGGHFFVSSLNTKTAKCSSQVGVPSSNHWIFRLTIDQ